MAALRSFSPHPQTNPCVIVLAGPTASGKSAVALALAKNLDLEIINADSRQIYRGLSAGTSAPTREELSVVSHRLYLWLAPEEPYNAGRFAADARLAVEEALAKKHTALLVGGAGLYLRALFDGLSPLPTADPCLRKKWEELALTQGKQALHLELEKVDPESAQKIPYQNIHRVIRALEVHALTGTPISKIHRESKQKSPALFNAPVYFFGLRWGRETLRARIRARTANLIAGLLQEAQNLMSANVPADAPAMKSLGYMDAWRYLRGELKWDELLERVQLATAQYAKRQMTFFNKDPRISWLENSEPFHPETIAQEILRRMGKNLL